MIEHLRAIDISAAVEVENMIKELEPLIDRIDSTFPTYTLHNHVHSENVLGLMERLLGEAIGALSAVETSILLLSAYAHDVGMYATPPQLERIKTSRAFKKFLAVNDQAFLRWGDDEASDFEVLREYCRSTHPQRASVWIREIRPDPLIIDGVDIRELLEQVCLAHGVDEAQVRLLDNDFHGSCDLIFCSILLRLADILDFDDSRAPRVLMDAIGLNAPTTKAAQFSSGEWRKHGVSNGFSFPIARSRGQRYVVNFSAVPSSPNEQADISYYLDLIDQEFRTAESLASHCSDRWRNHNLPGSLNRLIQPSNYEYGDYRVTIDAGAVLDLFTGTNLYANEHVFLRELIQNALDAHRARRALDPDFGRAAITVRSWREGDEAWLRIDDRGIGMSADVLRTYMLRVGASYYESASFRALLRRTKKGRDLKTIGRFGVGLLSIFMVADRVEVTTLRDEDDYSPVRASFGSLDTYFVVQTGKNVPDRYPSPESKSGDDGYRKDGDFGTSIALRFKPELSYSDEELTLLLAAAVLDAPDDVILNGSQINKPFTDSFYKLASSAHGYPLPGLTEFTNMLQERGGERTAAALRDLVLQSALLDFSNGSSQLTGSGAVAYIDWTMVYEAFDSDREALSAPKHDELDDADRFQMHYDAVEESLLVRVRLGAKETLLDDEDADEDRRWWDRIVPGSFDVDEQSMAWTTAIPIESMIAMTSPEWWRQSEIYAGPGYLRSHWVGAEWSHNGVRLPIGHNHWAASGSALSGVEYSGDPVSMAPFVSANIFGALALNDDLRVDVNVSRDRILRVPFSVQSAVRLAILRALRGTESPALRLLGESVKHLSWERLSNSWGSDLDNDDAMNPLASRLRDEMDDSYYSGPTVSALRAELLANASSGWLSEPILVRALGDRISVTNALDNVRDQNRIELMPMSTPGTSWERTMAWVLVVDRFNLRALESGNVILEAKDNPSEPFFEKDSYTLARLWDPNVLIARFSWDVSYLNTEHPFMVWLRRALNGMASESRHAFAEIDWLGSRGGVLTLAPLWGLLAKVEWLPGVAADPFDGPLGDDSIFVAVDDD